MVSMGKDSCKTRRETFKFCEFVRLLLEVWQTAMWFAPIKGACNSIGDKLYEVKHWLKPLIYIGWPSAATMRQWTKHDFWEVSNKLHTSVCAFSDIT